MLIYASAIFLSAFLLFLVQPMIARIILPWFGGGAAVWSTCLMFFQSALLGGYLYSHLVARRLSPKRQAAVHVALLAVSLIALPILPNPAWKPADSQHPEWRILFVLAATAGIPYLLLSTTGPLLQAWFARAYPLRSPYRLYALSNLGSLLALVGYPLAIEPLLPIRMQAYAWSSAYALFVLVCGYVAWSALRNLPERQESAAPTIRPAWTELLLWAGLAFCPAALLAGVTSHMTQNVAPVPLLWVAPLALYLLSFILTFESPRWYKRWFWFPAFVFAGSIMLSYLFPSNLDLRVRVVVPIFLSGFFAAAMSCHGELYRRRPQPESLTWFYLMLAVGGAVAGVFVGLLSPEIFNYYYELPIAFLITVALLIVTYSSGENALPGPAARVVQFAVLGAMAAGSVYLIVWNIPHWASEYRVVARNFYGVLRVDDTPATATTAGSRELLNGTISHGSEFTAPERHLEPTTYYSPVSGVGMAIQDSGKGGPRRVGVIGLGAGTLAAYGRPQDVYRFYDINPLVADIARTQFFYLNESPEEKAVILGDARLALEREAPQNFDVLAVDAFSGDSIPIHLLTIEAIELYLSHLKPDGILAVHISNRYLDLSKVVGRAVEKLKIPAILITAPDDSDKDWNRTDWALLTRDPHRFDSATWKTENRFELAKSKIRLWTDDYSTILPVLK